MELGIPGFASLWGMKKNMFTFFTCLRRFIYCFDYCRLHKMRITSAESVFARLWVVLYWKRVFVQFGLYHLTKFIFFTYMYMVLVNLLLSHYYDMFESKLKTCWGISTFKYYKCSNYCIGVYGYLFPSKLRIDSLLYKNNMILSYSYTSCITVNISSSDFLPFP